MVSPALSFRELRCRKTLILGDVGTGKTTLTRRLLNEALEESKEPITVLDFAPPTKVVAGLRVGGFITDTEHPRLRHLKSELVETPRLSASSPEDLVMLAERNMKLTGAMLDEFKVSPTKTLFVNDASIHLQRGGLRDLWRAFTAAETVIANGYMGEALREDYGSGVSRRERSMMRRLAAKMDRVIVLRGEYGIGNRENG